MTVRIKRLELNGFKSFPRPTVFEFDTGITAIIGPNGSGKSNIADAMRWVLGEQSYSNLRGRKAEDVIFSGSTARSAMGMAEVTLTLDNSSGDLPIEFQEVSITRRAYRSGENQYLLNGAKVRLKDINQVTASFGQAHTVIGQGLVDAALSQRPEERRGLFEHAAGITGLRMKYAATERHLAETTANSTRLEDLLHELEPRLKTLERQAKQAREYADVQRDLRETTLRYYSALWREHRHKLEALQQAVGASDDELQKATVALDEAQSSIQTVQAELESLQERAASLEQHVNDKRNHLRDLEHNIALSRQRQDSLRQVIEQYETRQHDLTAEASRIDSEYETRQGERDAFRAELATVDERLADREQERSRIGNELESLSNQRSELERKRESLLERMYRAEAEQEYRRQQQQDLQARTESIGTRRAELEAEIAALVAAVEQSTTEKNRLASVLSERQTGISDLENDLESQHADARRIRQEIENVTADRARRSARLDALQRLQESGEGLHRGVQTVLDFAGKAQLDGIIGTLASQISVPEQLETAVEAALGGHLQDIIVQRWTDAEAAIEMLKKQNAGRATFQPLDTQRRSGNQNRPSINGEPGVHGVAVDLIEFGSELQPVLEGLIGRTVITDDLPSTRRVLNKLRPGWTVVTLEGEVTRAGGSVTGGSRIRQSGTLGRERELRDLPGEIERIDKKRQEIQHKLDHADNGIREHESRLEQARQALRAAERDADAAERELSAQEHRLRQARESLESLVNETSNASSEAEARATEIDELASRNEQDRQTFEELEVQHADLTRQIDEVQQGFDDSLTRQLESERSRLRERLSGLDQQISSLEHQRNRVQRDLDGAKPAQEAAEHSIQQLQTEITELEQQVVQARAELETIASDQTPLAEQRSSLQQKLSNCQTELRQLQTTQRELERQRDSQHFDIEREKAQGEHLIERVFDILEIEDPVPLLEQQPVEDELDMQKLETSVHRLRQRARRIGAFGEETITQYEQEQERYTFLRGQLDDVQSGAEALRSILTDLDRSMSDEFDHTFGQVAQAFQSTFHRLFGGGTARLVRNDEEDRTGIDIVAQPPGKKLQSLALLSGGERALTAVALLFAIQRVNPSPFCLLDEVDAALDEANVVRFRDELRDLAVNTQFVVVTHNRATIEGADVLYGITMGTDAISRVVSLRLPEEAPVATA